jgi:hypothetical protein
MTDEPAHDREAALMGRCEMLRAGGLLALPPTA